MTAHIEPFDTKLQKGSAIDEVEIRKIVLKVTERRRRAFRIKRIMTFAADEKRYINIDCCFSGKTAIKDAHELASYIEESVKKRFAETVVTVHMAPKKRKRDKI